MKCRSFILELEGYLDLHPECVGRPLSAPLEQHLDQCGSCREGAEAALRSRVLLRSVQDPAAAADPYFYTRLKPRLEAAQQLRTRVKPWVLSLRRPGRDLVFASAALMFLLAGFVHNVRTTERTDASEAMALDAPHGNFDHQQVRQNDILATLVNQ